MTDPSSLPDHVAALVAAVTGTLAEAAISYLFLRESRLRHPPLWRDLAQPMRSGAGGPFRHWRLGRYLWRRDYRALGDPASVAFADRMRLPMLLGFGAGLVGIVLAMGFLVASADWS